MKIHYRNDGLIDEKGNYLDIPKKERKTLVEMLDNFNFDDAIEINIVKPSWNKMKKTHLLLILIGVLAFSIFPVFYIKTAIASVY